MAQKTPFQERCLCSTESVLSSHGLRPNWEQVVPTQPDRAGSDEEILLRSKFDYAGRDYEVWIYGREAGIFIDGHWLACERADFSDDTHLVQSLSDCLKLALAGATPEEAYRSSMRARSESVTRWWGQLGTSGTSRSGSEVVDPRDYVVVVESSPPEQAERLYRNWLSLHPEIQALPTGDDVLIDVIRGMGGESLRRYRVRRSLVESVE